MEHTETPLHYAVKEIHTEIVHLLLKHGTNPNIKDGTGSSRTLLDLLVNVRDQEGTWNNFMKKKRRKNLSWKEREYESSKAKENMLIIKKMLIQAGAKKASELRSPSSI